MGFFGGCAMSAPAAMSVLGANSGHLLPGRRGGRLAVVALDSQVHSRPQLLVLGAIGLTGAYWWFVLVPSARVRLAVNKKSGTLRKYLEELKQDDSRSLERWFYANWLEKMDPETKYLLREGDEAADGYSVKLSDTGGVQEGRDAEDSLEDVIRKAKATPKFWSADNPVLVGAALSILGAALFGSLTGV